MDSRAKVKVNFVVFGKSFIVCLIIGVLCVIFSIFLFAERKSDYVRTSATITNIEVVEHGEDDDYVVTVEYTVDGEVYSKILNSYYFTYRIGKQIDVFYDPSDPSKVISADDKVMAKVLLVAGVSFIVAGVVTSIATKGKKKEESESGYY